MKKLVTLAYPIVAVLSLAAAGTALADDITPDTTASHVFSTQKTREQVQTELAAARKNGSMKVYSNTYNPLTAAKSTRNRADVRAEQAADWYGEDSGSFASQQRGARPAREAAPTYAGRTR